MGVKIKSEKREDIGKNASRRVRREGNVPAVLYGADIENVLLTLKKNDIFSVLKSETGENTIFQVSFDGKSIDAMIKELQVNPVTQQLMHVDLVQIAMDKIVEVTIPIELEGEPVGVKTEGGFIDFVSREVEVECLPKDIPEHITLNISSLHLHQSIKVENLPVIEGVTYTSDPHALVVLIEAPTKEEVEVEVKEEEAEMIKEEAEPEVIKKEKTRETEEEEKD